MRKKQVTAILLSVILVVSASMPMSGITVAAAEYAEAGGTEMVLGTEQDESEVEREESVSEDSSEQATAGGAETEEMSDGANLEEDAVSQETPERSDSIEDIKDEEELIGEDKLVPDVDYDSGIIEADSDDVEGTIENTEIEIVEEDEASAEENKPASAEEAVDSGMCGEDVEWSFDADSGVLTISGTGPMKNYTMTSHPDWLDNGLSVKKVIIEEGVSSIGDWALFSCTELEEVEMAGSIEEIGSFAFQHCSAISEIQLPDGVRELKDHVFANCHALVSVRLPGSVESVGDNCFYNCENIQAIHVSEENAVYCDEDGVLFSKDMKKLIACPKAKKGNYYVPEQVQIIGSYALADCDNLTMIQLPEGLLSLEKGAISACDQLMRIDLPDTIQTIEESALKSNINLSTVSIPGSVKVIEKDALYQCGNLRTVKLGEGIERIGFSAFALCPIIEIVIPNSVNEIQEYAFDNTGLKKIEFQGKPEVINDYAFSNVESKVIFQPSQWEETERNDYGGSLTWISAEEDIKPEIVESGDMGESVTWELDDTGTLTIKGSGATEGYPGGASPWIHRYENIKRIVIEEGITEIGIFAFNYCRNVESIEWPKSLREIGYGAFHLCESLAEVPVISKDIEVVGWRAFSGCMSLKTLKVEEGNPYYYVIDDVLYEDKDGRVEITQVPAGRKSNELYIPDGVDAVGKGALEGCESITEIRFPDTLKEIPFMIFDDTAWMRQQGDLISINGILVRYQGDEEEVQVPEGTKVINEGAFYYCSQLQKIILPEGVTEIGPKAFYHCEALESIDFPESITSVGEGFLYGCKNLVEVELPERITQIPIDAFGRCSSLRSVTIPRSVESLYVCAFNKIDKLEQIIYKGTRSEWDEIAICLAVYWRELDEWEEMLSKIELICLEEDIFDLSDCDITVDSAVYTGRAETPAVTVTMNGVTLQKDTDYSLSYENNVDAGTAKVVVTGAGQYSGVAEKTFTIAKAEQKLSAKDIKIKAGDSEKAVVSGAQGALSFSSADPEVAMVAEDGTVTAVTEGTTKIIVNAAETPNYKNAIAIEIQVTVLSAAINVSELDIAVSDTDLVYDGKTKTPEVVVKYQGNVVANGFTISYSNNTNAGDKTAKVTVLGDGKVFAGTREVPFSIAKAEQKLSADGLTIKAGENAKAVVSGAQGALSFISADTEIAVADADGSVTAIKEGTTKITVTAVETENYRAAEPIEIEVTVLRSIVNAAELEVTVDVVNLVYDGKAKTPSVTVRYDGENITEGFTVSYDNNVNAGLDTAKVIVTGDDQAFAGTKETTFTILPGKTTRGDMFNLANNVKVTWKEVPGAKYYKVYREGITDPKESQSEPVIVTTGLVGWDKQPGLTNGHAYRYRIVASLTGKGDPSGDSTLSYSKIMYRLKTVVIRSVKNTAAGKVTVKYDKTTSGDSYVLQYSERQDMVGAKTKVVLGANKTSYTIGGLKKGKTYYISIRVRKKVNGIDYYTTFGVPKKVKVTK